MSAAVWDSPAKVEAIQQQQKYIENKILNEYTFTGFVFIWSLLISIWYKVTCMNVRNASYILNSEQFTQR